MIGCKVEIADRLVLIESVTTDARVELSLIGGDRSLHVSTLCPVRRMNEHSGKSSSEHHRLSTGSKNENSLYNPILTIRLIQNLPDQ